MKIVKNKFVIIFIILTLLALIYSGCKKEESQVNGTISLKVFLINSVSTKGAYIYANGAYESVNIDIQKVSIHISSDTAVNSGWFDLETNTGIYDLLDYEAGNDTLIAFDTLLQPQNISQIRLLLGNNNTVVDGGETYDLETPSGQTSGLKIQVHADLQADFAYKILLDFDAEKSIIKTGNGKYKLKPVINTTVEQQ
ncbi:MAG: DUF4382 domain-containing protein [Bacteroidales bacterium]|nr:DUF4382 domain-containing protein [Bacteroidales bacterium]